MPNLATASLHIFHGGSFKKVHHQLYTKSEASNVYMDPDYINVDEIKERVVNLGYSKERIKELYCSRLNVPV